jgi:hypothetical protein
VLGEVAVLKWEARFMANYRFSLRSLLVAFAAAAVILTVGALLWDALPDAHPAAVRNQYLAGQITLEEAVSEVGDEAYEWVERRAQLDEARREAEAMREQTCSDCGTEQGQLHDMFCTRELCPFCGGQLVTCGCIKTVLKLTAAESEAVDEYIDDSVEPLLSIHQEWVEALEAKGRIPFSGR